jgi:hypothetical protein
MGKTNPSAKHGKPDGSQMNKSKTDCFVVDWDEVDQIIKSKTVPDGAITKEMLINKYHCSRTGASGMMDKMVSAGWTKHMMHNGKANIVYVIKDRK